MNKPKLLNPEYRESQDSDIIKEKVEQAKILAEQQAKIAQEKAVVVKPLV